MKMRIGLIFCLLTVLLTCSLSTCVLADTLDGTLNRLDRSGSQFKGMTANFHYVKHTAIVNENSPSDGTIKIKKKPPNDILGLLDFVSPDKKTVVLNGKSVDIYLPNIKTVQKVDLGKHKVLVEQFFLFGFGTSRSDLEHAYSVSLGGPETVSGDATTRLELVSKNPEVSRQLSKFELWISDKTGLPVQQKFYEPSGDYNVFTYSHMETPNLKDSDLKAPYKGFKEEILNK
jgi:outer membrane lipoprotein-sorting protein